MVHLQCLYRSIDTHISKTMAESEVADLGGKDSSEDQDAPAKCHDNAGDHPENNDKDVDSNTVVASEESAKAPVLDGDITHEEEEEEVKTDDEEYLLDQLDEAEEELKRWREQKRRNRTMRRDMDSSDERQQPMDNTGEGGSDDEGPDDDDKKNDAIAFRRILKRLDASEEKFICDVCDEMLKTPASLSTHLMRVHKKVCMK